MTAILDAAKNLALLAICALLFTGCAAPVARQPLPSAPKMTFEEILAGLKSQREIIKPLKASGQCLLRYRIDGKEHKQNFPVKIWINPPDEIYLQGDVAFDADGIVIGSNSDEFWFWLRPKEISSYWWGKWSQAGNWRGLAISPALFLEAFGSLDVPVGDWSVTYGQKYVLWLHNVNGELLKRVFIEPEDFVVSRIEYYGSSQDIAASADFSAHKLVSTGFCVPTRIKITARSSQENDDSAEISLSSVTRSQLTEAQRQRLFVRPKPQGFEHVYEIVGGKKVEQVND